MTFAIGSGTRFWSGVNSCNGYARQRFVRNGIGNGAIYGCLSVYGERKQEKYE